MRSDQFLPVRKKILDRPEKILGVTVLRGKKLENTHYTGVRNIAVLCSLLSNESYESYSEKVRISRRKQGHLNS